MKRSLAFNVTNVAILKNAEKRHFLYLKKVVSPSFCFCGIMQMRFLFVAWYNQHMKTAKAIVSWRRSNRIINNYISTIIFLTNRAYRMGRDSEKTEYEKISKGYRNVSNAAILCEQFEKTL